MYPKELKSIFRQVKKYVNNVSRPTMLWYDGKRCYQPYVFTPYIDTFTNKEFFRGNFFDIVPTDNKDSWVWYDFGSGGKFVTVTTFRIHIQKTFGAKMKLNYCDFYSPESDVDLTKQKK
jgi:hypothetical protein